MKILSTKMMIMIAMTMMVKYNYVERFQTKTEDLVGAKQSWIGKYFPKKDKNLLRLYPVELWRSGCLFPEHVILTNNPDQKKRAKKLKPKKFQGQNVEKSHFKDVLKG